jgi:type I restriction enzyme S subunit
VVGRKGNVGSVWWIDRPFFPIDTTYYVDTTVPLGLMYWQLRDMTFIDSHAAVPGLSREQAYKLPLLVPPQALARDFDAMHRTFFDSISALRRANARLGTTRDLLLPRLVTGRLDVSGVDLGPLFPDENAG